MFEPSASTNDMLSKVRHFLYIIFLKGRLSPCAYTKDWETNHISTTQLSSRKKLAGNICNYSEKKFAGASHFLFDNQSVLEEEKSGFVSEY